DTSLSNLAYTVIKAALSQSPQFLILQSSLFSCKIACPHLGQLLDNGLKKHPQTGQLFRNFPLSLRSTGFFGFCFSAASRHSSTVPISLYASSSLHCLEYTSSGIRHNLLFLYR